MKNIFLTGEKHIGKSTLIQSILNRLNLSVGGYITERVIKNNKTTYIARSLYNGSESYPIANVNNSDRTREVFMDSFDIGIVSILEKSLKNRDVIILDELGFFEDNSKIFKYKIYELLDSNKVILGVIKDCNCEFLNNIRQRDDVLLIKVTKENREETLNRLIGIMDGLCNT